MAQARTIRAWIRTQPGGEAISDSGNIPTEWRRAYYEAHPPGGEPSTEAGDVSETFTADAPPVEETPPKVGDPEPMVGRVVNRIRQTTSGSSRDSKQSSSKPRPRRAASKRLSLGHLLSEAWEYLAIPVSRMSIPVAAVMNYQAPTVGPILDESVAGTILDKILQPIAKIDDAIAPVNAILGPPMYVFLMEKMPDQIPKFIPRLRRAMYSYATLAAPHLDKQHEITEKMKEEYGESIDEMIVMVVVAIVGEDRAAAMFKAGMR